VPDNVKILNNVFDTSIINTPDGDATPIVAITVFSTPIADDVATDTRIDRNLIVLQHQGTTNSSTECGILLAVSGGAASDNPSEITNNVFSIAGRTPSPVSNPPVGIYARPSSTIMAGIFSGVKVDYWNMTGNTFKTDGTRYWHHMMWFGSDDKAPDPAPDPKEQKGIFLVQNVFGGKADKAISFCIDSATITVAEGKGNVFNGNYDVPVGPINDVGVQIYRGAPPSDKKLFVNNEDVTLWTPKAVQNLLK